MRVCPTCQQSYGDDVEACPDDGDSLVDPLPENPALQEVKEVAATDHTSMIDLEAIEAKRAERKAARAEAEGDVEGGENEGVDFDPDKTPPPEPGQRELDAEATGTLARSRVSKKPRRSQAAAVEADDVPAVRELPADRRVNEELTAKDHTGRRDKADQTGVSRVTRAGQTRAGQTRAGQTQAGQTRNGTQQTLFVPQGRRITPVQVAFLTLFVLVVVLGGIIVAFRATAIMTVTTVPPGAEVTLDGEVLGLAPLQKRVRTGSHAIELTLPGYEPFKEVVTVESGGLPFLQPLRALPPPPPPPPTPEQLAAELVAQAERMLEQGDLQGARDKLLEAQKLVGAAWPGDDEALKKLAELQAIEDDKAAAAQKGAAQSARLRRAREEVQDGIAAYKKNDLVAAKKRLYGAIAIDKGNPEPHRWLARIFNREGDDDKVRYHLERYVALGGADGDYKVREWLKTLNK